jgi:uncharacterized membrane protein
MPRFALYVLVASLLAAAWYIDATTAVLPERVATHFGGGGRPNGWMTRDGYRVFMLLFVTLLPLFMVLMAGGMPRLFPNATNIPNRHHWMAPERREEALRFLAAHACWLGWLMVVFIVGIHVLLLQANHSEPVRLPEQPFFMMLGAFVLGLAVWIVVLLRRFRRPA